MVRTAFGIELSLAPPFELAHLEFANFKIANFEFANFEFDGATVTWPCRDRGVNGSLRFCHARAARIRG
jgi:hypothetical protein